MINRHDPEVIARRKVATRKALDQIAMAMIKFNNLPEKTPAEYYAKCKELRG